MTTITLKLSAAERTALREEITNYASSPAGRCDLEAFGTFRSLTREDAIELRDTIDRTVAVLDQLGWDDDEDEGSASLEVDPQLWIGWVTKAHEEARLSREYEEGCLAKVRAGDNGWFTAPTQERSIEEAVEIVEYCRGRAEALAAVVSRLETTMAVA